MDRIFSLNFSAHPVESAAKVAAAAYLAYGLYCAWDADYLPGQGQPVGPNLGNLAKFVLLWPKYNGPNAAVLPWVVSATP